jgi:hypothetical protein
VRQEGEGQNVGIGGCVMACGLLHSRVAGNCIDLQFIMYGCDLAASAAGRHQMFVHILFVLGAAKSKNHIEECGHGEKLACVH